METLLISMVAKFRLWLTPSIVTLFCTWTGITQAKMNDPFDPPSLKIVWDRDLGRKDANSISSKGGVPAWAYACPKLAAGLMVGKGPWGTGLFSEASCHIGAKKTAGADSADPWVLHFVEGETEATLSLYASEKENAPIIASAKFPGSIWAMKYFTDQGFAELISLRLLNELPAMGFLPRSSISKSLHINKSVLFIPPSGTRLYKVPEPPEELIVFSAHLNGDLIKPVIKGNGVRSSFVDPQTIEQRDTAGPSPAETPTAGTPVKKTIPAKNKNGDNIYHLTWTFEEKVQTASKEMILAFHDSRGPGMMVTELNQSIDDAAKLLDEANRSGLFGRFLKEMISTTAAGSIALRYGTQILPGSTVIHKMNYFGFVGELCCGILDRVRYYYEKSPNASGTRGLVTENIGWSKHFIGKSMSLETSQIVDRIYIVPKLGIWHMDAKVGSLVGDDGLPVAAGTFHMARGYSASIEFGIEWLSSWYTIRPWTSVDYASSSSAISKKAVTSARGGLDAFWTAGPTFTAFSQKCKLSFMTFAFLDNITLKDANSNSESVAQGESVTSFGTQLGFSGVGVAVSW